MPPYTTSVVSGPSYTAGANITISPDNVISSSGGGTAGSDGRGISNVEKVNDELVLSFTDSTQQNLGNIKGDQGIQGNTGNAGTDGTDGTDGQNGNTLLSEFTTDYDAPTTSNSTLVYTGATSGKQYSWFPRGDVITPMLSNNRVVTQTAIRNYIKPLLCQYGVEFIGSSNGASSVERIVTFPTPFTDGTRVVLVQEAIYNNFEQKGFAFFSKIIGLNNQVFTVRINDLYNFNNAWGENSLQIHWRAWEVPEWTTTGVNVFEQGSNQTYNRWSSALSPSL